jgi:hypothetical protein
MSLPHVNKMLDFSDLDLTGVDQLEFDIMAVSESSAMPEGAASTGTWSCGGRYSCSCSYSDPPKKPGTREIGD